MIKILPFNKPHLTGKEIHFIYDAVNTGKISGNGKYTQMCQSFFEKQYGFRKVLLTTSCTDALEMCAILANITDGDEVIMPSFTFVSTAIAFVRQGAKVIFADSSEFNPNIDAESIEDLITDKTVAIVPVHYAGVSCDMDKIMKLATKYNLLVIEDAAQAIDSYYVSKVGEKRALGSIGHLAAFSFHETKNIISGEGGMIAINDERFIGRAEIIWEKGTNRAEFFRGEVNKYGWKYYDGLKDWSCKNGIKIAEIPEYATNNAHMFYILCANLEQRSSIINHLKKYEIYSVFHYISLHSSEYYKNKHGNRELRNSDLYTECLLRLPFYYDLSLEDVDRVIRTLVNFEGK
jgi:dTDP-4-amino-4,6-dideoxygalactose transaminase